MKLLPFDVGFASRQIPDMPLTSRPSSQWIGGDCCPGSMNQSLRELELHPSSALRTGSTRLMTNIGSQSTTPNLASQRLLKQSEFGGSLWKNSRSCVLCEAGRFAHGACSCILRASQGFWWGHRINTPCHTTITAISNSRTTSYVKSGNPWNFDLAHAVAFTMFASTASSLGSVNTSRLNLRRCWQHRCQCRLTQSTLPRR